MPSPTGRRRVLAVDDEAQIANALTRVLTRSGFDVHTEATGQAALEYAAATEPDLVILDMGLPDMAGTEVIRQLRSWSKVPIIVLTGQDASAGMVSALDIGADDYVTKPFVPDELVARGKAVLRRSGAARPAGHARFDALSIDFARQLVTLDEVQLRLTKTEYALLATMTQNPGRLLTSHWLLREVWGGAYEDSGSTLRFYIRRLRQRLADDVASPQYIQTESGAGYRWIAEPTPNGTAPPAGRVSIT
jgi:two-component system KDP operon response regulator KdpE